MLDDDSLLSVRDLRVSFDTPSGEVQAVRGVSFAMRPGEILGIVGESGCGKSVTAQTILKLLPMPPGRIVEGKILFEGRDLVALSEPEMRHVRSEKIGMVFQDPMTSLNPTMRIGHQIGEALRYHRGVTRSQMVSEVVQLLEAVGIAEARKRFDQYPHELSGGMRQRVMIAMALSCQPRLMIADEPTTALDVTTQTQILDLIKALNARLGMAVLLITHDLNVIAHVCDRVLVMYAGEVMEIGSVDTVLKNPQHPYTQGLINSIPGRREGKGRLTPIPGTPPDLLHPPSGCPFHPRCRYAMNICDREIPPLFETGPGHRAACWLHHPQAKGRHG